MSDTDVLGALRAYTREHGRVPTVTTSRHEHRRPGTSVIIRDHGSWSAAVSAALGDSRGDSSQPGFESVRRLGDHWPSVGYAPARC